MLYAHLRYMVRFGGDTTECFEAFMGILIGDPASPYDLSLSDWVVSHLELADDMAFISLFVFGMQNKLDYFNHYCATSFLLVNVPSPLPPLMLYGEPLQYVASATYHYLKKHAAAQRAANASLALKSYLGPLPPGIALKLYRTHVNSQLVAGCEVALDSCLTSLAALRDVQHTYLRRALHVSSRAQHSPLFPETGTWPLRYCRYDLALRVLLYILTDTLGAALPVPVILLVGHFPSSDAVRSARAHPQASLAEHLHLTTMQSGRLPVLHHHVLHFRGTPAYGTPSTLPRVQV
ncbi:hypothetical protein BV20DRAFT_1038981 [Pilatotrama ljubarskyi]|nr:hypothetical protein BV20DRAFT_1038981 [Pilatotrama ljubarskyi]